MAYKINDNCISCGACEAECPVGAISAGDGKFVIDPEILVVRARTFAPGELHLKSSNLQ